MNWLLPELAKVLFQGPVGRKYIFQKPQAGLRGRFYAAKNKNDQLSESAKRQIQQRCIFKFSSLYGSELRFLSIGPMRKLQIFTGLEPEGS